MQKYIYTEPTDYVSRRIKVMQRDDAAIEELLAGKQYIYSFEVGTINEGLHYHILVPGVTDGAFKVKLSRFTKGKGKSVSWSAECQKKLNYTWLKGVSYVAKDGDVHCSDEEMEYWVSHAPQWVSKDQWKPSESWRKEAARDRDWVLNRTNLLSVMRKFFQDSGEEVRDFKVVLSKLIATTKWKPDRDLRNRGVDEYDISRFESGGDAAGAMDLVKSMVEKGRYRPY